MSETHLEALLDVIHRRDTAGLSDTVVLRGPILPQSSEGKAGLHGLSKAPAPEFGPKGIIANAVALGATDTQHDWRQE